MKKNLHLHLHLPALLIVARRGVQCQEGVGQQQRAHTTINNGRRRHISKRKEGTLRTHTHRTQRGSHNRRNLIAPRYGILSSFPSTGCFHCFAYHSCTSFAYRIVCVLCVRAGDAKSVISAYEKLAFHFQALENFPIAIHFFQKVRVCGAEFRQLGRLLRCRPHFPLSAIPHVLFLMLLFFGYSALKSRNK